VVNYPNSQINIQNYPYLLPVNTSVKDVIYPSFFSDH